MKPGYKQTEVGVIPAEWEVKPLRGINFDISDGNYSSKYPKASDFRHFGVPFIRANNIQGMTVVDDDMRFISSAQHQELQKGHLKANDLLITTRGDIGQLALVPERHIDANINAQLVRINAGNTGVDHRFLVYAMSSESAQEQLKNLQTGSALKQLPIGRLIQLQLTFPPPAEQRAIATVLSDVDGLLGGLDRLIAKKRDLKQAAMQQLLTGQTRLPGFHGEWELKPLGDVVQIKKGQLITSSTLMPGDIPVIAGGKQPAYYHASANRYGRTVTISASGASAGYVALYDEPIFASDCSTISESESYCLDFVFYQLLCKQQRIYKAQTGGAQPHIHAKDLNPILFSFPPLPEQTAIAEVLTEMDGELAVLERRREKTRALKQAMMQELLTGKTRLV